MPQLDGAPPAPVSALWTGPDEIAVTFSEALVPGAVAKGNWLADIDALEYECEGANAAGAVVTLLMSPIGAAPVGRRVSYTATPADVIGAVTGLPAAPFVDFPVV